MLTSQQAEIDLEIMKKLEESQNTMQKSVKNNKRSNQRQTKVNITKYNNDVTIEMNASRSLEI